MAHDTRVMVIDDDENIHGLYRTIFNPSVEEDRVGELLGEIYSSLSVESDREERMTYPLDLFSQGEEAIVAAEQQMNQGLRYTHAFIDMRMPPGLDGLQTAKALFRLDPEIKIIFVTAYADYTAEDIMEAIGDNFSYIQKPFSEHTILTQVEFLESEVPGDEWDTF